MKDSHYPALLIPILFFILKTVFHDKAVSGFQNQSDGGADTAFLIGILLKQNAEISVSCTN